MVERTERWLGWAGKVFALIAILLIGTFIILGPYRHSSLMHTLAGKTTVPTLESEAAAVAASATAQPAASGGCGCPLCCPASPNDV